jgi:hypothetical protein
MAKTARTTVTATTFSVVSGIRARANGISRDDSLALPVGVRGGRKIAVTLAATPSRAS